MERILLRMHLLKALVRRVVLDLRERTPFSREVSSPDPRLVWRTQTVALPVATSTVDVHP